MENWIDESDYRVCYVVC